MTYNAFDGTLNPTLPTMGKVQELSTPTMLHYLCHCESTLAALSEVAMSCVV